MLTIFTVEPAFTLRTSVALRANRAGLTALANESRLTLHALWTLWASLAVFSRSACFATFTSSTDSAHGTSVAISTRRAHLAFLSLYSLVSLYACLPSFSTFPSLSLFASITNRTRNRRTIFKSLDTLQRTDNLLDYWLESRSDCLFKSTHGCPLMRWI